MIHERQYLLNKQLTLVTFCFFLTLCLFHPQTRRQMCFSLIRGWRGFLCNQGSSMFTMWPLFLMCQRKTVKYLAEYLLGFKAPLSYFAKCKKNVNLWTYRMWISTTHGFCMRWSRSSEHKSKWQASTQVPFQSKQILFFWCCASFVIYHNEVFIFSSV